MITIGKYTNCTNSEKFCDEIGVACIHTKATKTQKQGNKRHIKNVTLTSDE